MKRHKVIKGERSLPYKRPFIAVLVLDFLTLVAVLGAVTCGVLLVTQGASRLMAHFCIGFLGLTALLSAIAYPVRRTAKCPLCRGAPLVDSGASKHGEASRIPLLSHGMTARVGLMMIQRFRCMYCGTPFDLHKKPGGGGRR